MNHFYPPIYQGWYPWQAEGEPTIVGEYLASELNEHFEFLLSVPKLHNAAFPPLFLLSILIEHQPRSVAPVQVCFQHYKLAFCLGSWEFFIYSQNYMLGTFVNLRLYRRGRLELKYYNKSNFGRSYPVQIRPSYQILKCSYTWSWQDIGVWILLLMECCLEYV